MRSLTLTLAAFFISIFSPAQDYQAVYGTPNSEDAYSVAVTHDNGFIECGSSWGNGAGGKDAMLLKTNFGGALQWSKQYGGSGDETAIYVKTLSDGGYVFCGETFSNSVNGDAFVARVDSAGNLVWWKDYGGPLYDMAYSVRPLSDGGFIVAGLTEANATYYDAFLLRTDANGDTLWTRTFGGPNIDLAVQVIPTSDSGFLFSGKELSYGAGSSDVWLLKTDANGNTQWNTQLGGFAWEEGMDLLEVPGGYMVCGGVTSCCFGNYDFLLLKTNLNGQLQWSKAYGGANVEASYNIQKVPGGGFIFVGYTETFGPGHSRGTDSSNVWLMRTDDNGDTLWSMAYGGLLKEECFSVANTSDGGFAIAGYTASFGDSLQAYIFKLDSLGYSGCNERRSHPDIADPGLQENHIAVPMLGPLPEIITTVTTSSPSATGTAICGGPLGIPPAAAAATPVQLFPNPAQDEMTIILPEGIFEIQVLDELGRTVKNYQAMPAGKNSISMKELNSGTYFVRVKETGSGMICVTRMIKL